MKVGLSPEVVHVVHGGEGSVPYPGFEIAVLPLQLPAWRKPLEGSGTQRTSEEVESEDQATFGLGLFRPSCFTHKSTVFWY